MTDKNDNVCWLDIFIYCWLAITVSDLFGIWGAGWMPEREQITTIQETIELDGIKYYYIDEQIGPKVPYKGYDRDSRKMLE